MLCKLNNKICQNPKSFFGFQGNHDLYKSINLILKPIIFILFKLV